MQFWNELEGRVIENRYPLRRLVRSEGRTAWFETEIQNGKVEPAIISLTESLTDEDEVTARLQAALELRDPHLVEIRQIGKAQLDKALFVYAIMEPTDQNLSDILRNQTLSKEEARQVAEAMVGALTAIHQRGLAHGRVEPASILAVGEAVKLRSDCLQSPGATRAGDVAGIGATLLQAFTQLNASSVSDAQINRIPAPFAEIVRNSLSARWSLAQIASVLYPPPGMPPAASPTPAAAMPVPAGPGATAIAPAERLASPAKGPASQSETTAPPQDEEKLAPALSRRVAIYIALAIVLAVILGWLVFRPKVKSPATPAAGTASSSQAPASLPEAAPPVAESVQPKPSAAIRTPEPAAGHARVPASGARSVWRVVAYTYRHEDQAQHKAEEINTAHPGLGATVFSPGGDPNHFLVVLGGAMDRQHAFQTRDKARRLGLADDTYVENFSE